MPQQSDALSVYRDLADHYDRLGQPSMRDRFLILAADAALQGGQPGLAEQFRQRLLRGTRHHMLRSYASFEEASAAPDVQTYLRDLRVNYPVETARELLEGLGSPSGDAGTLPIPPTAPLIDLNGPSARSRGRTWGPQPIADPYPLQDELEHTPAPKKPLAQPLPGRSAGPRASLPAETYPVLPVAEPVRAAWAAAPAPAPARLAPSGPSAWVSVALGAVAAVLAAAAALVTLARPFWP